MLSFSKKLGWELKRVLPRPIFHAIRGAVRSAGSRKKALERLQLPRVTREDLVSSLRAAGLAEGSLVCVHSALSRIGDVEGGAQTVVEAILEVVSEAGTVVMPAYASADDFVADAARGIVPDLRTASSRTGKITEAFRTTPGVLRSSHPFSSCVAWGKHAEYIVRDHAKDLRICHKDSPLGRFLKLGGTVVGLGTDIGIVSLYHCAEDIGGDFPFRTYGEPFLGEYIDAQGLSVRRELVRYDADVARFRIDQPYGEWIRERLREHLERRGILRPAFMFGCARSWTMDATELIREIRALAISGVTIYSRPDDNIVRTMSAFATHAPAVGAV
jgi:aminoglycoside 3-N-acetyltransferase